VARNLKPSPRGELEITDVNRQYLDWDALNVSIMGRGHAWLDTGTHESLLQASEFVHVMEQRQGLRIGCLEEAAYRMGFIDQAQLADLGRAQAKSEYGRYLRQIAERPPGVDEPGE